MTPIEVLAKARNAYYDDPTDERLMRLYEALFVADAVHEAEIARLRKIEEAAREVLLLCSCSPDWLMQDGNHHRECIQSEPAVDALRAALAER